VFLQYIDLGHIRCLHRCTISCQAPITLIYGHNASGKTSILEALYYAAYLRSFRTRHPQEMIAFNAQACTISLTGVSHHNSYDHAWHLHIGCSYKKRVVKKNKRPISSHSELLACYRAIHITDHDMEIVTGSPKARRRFIDHVALLYDTQYARLMKNYNKVLQQRHALIQQGHIHERIWLYHMWSYAYRIVEYRTTYLRRLAAHAQELAEHYFPHLSLSISYVPRHTVDTHFDTFYAKHCQNIAPREKYEQSVKWGPHLDDIDIRLHGMPARVYASRGQQKLIMVLLKIAAVRSVYHPILLLVDDIFADFDPSVIHNIVSVLANNSHQMIMTTPEVYHHIAQALAHHNYHTVSISEAKSYHKNRNNEEK